MIIKENSTISINGHDVDIVSIKLTLHKNYSITAVISCAIEEDEFNVMANVKIDPLSVAEYDDETAFEIHFQDVEQTILDSIKETFVSIRADRQEMILSDITNIVNRFNIENEDHQALLVQMSDGLSVAFEIKEGCDVIKIFMSKLKGKDLYVSDSKYIALDKLPSELNKFIDNLKNKT